MHTKRRGLKAHDYIQMIPHPLGCDSYNPTKALFIDITKDRIHILSCYQKPYHFHYFLVIEIYRYTSQVSFELL